MKRLEEERLKAMKEQEIVEKMTVESDSTIQNLEEVCTLGLVYRGSLECTESVSTCSILRYTSVVSRDIQRMI